MKLKKSDSLSRWAPDCERLYKHVRLLRCGAFTSVWVAKPKGKNLLHPKREKCAGCCVAIKSTLITQRTDSDIALKFAKRETQILLELDHPHIIKVVREFPYLDSPVFSVALTLASGPTIEELVEYRGALGIPFVQNVTKQLVSALAYMHFRAVIHRDVEPDNVIVMGASLSDDANWCDSYDDPEVQNLLPRWKAMLLDFGLAKALAPQNIQKKDIETSNSTVLHQMNSLRSKFAAKMSLNDKLYFKTEVQDPPTAESAQVLDSAAEGDKKYVAPEVLNERYSRRGSDKGQNALSYSTSEDAYSLGALMRYMLTGVPPECIIDEYVSHLNIGLVDAADCFPFSPTLACCNRRKRVKRRFKHDDDIPKEAKDLVFSLTIKNTKSRLTLRHAQCHPWIKQKEDDDPSVHAPLKFLKFMRYSKIIEGLDEDRYSSSDYNDDDED
jgi:serine/threonine protein kinase